MKWAFVIFFIFNLNSNCSASQISILNYIHIQEPTVKVLGNVMATISPLFLTIGENNNLKDESLVDFVAMLLLYLTTFLVVITPFTLIYFWIFYSFKYVKKYRRVFSIKKWFRGNSKLGEEHLNDTVWLSYRNVYAPMIGFGVAIIAYVFSSIRFMVLNFDTMETAMAQYFKFPFFVLDKFGWIQIKEVTEMNIDFFWNQMLLVVVISGLFFLVGYLLGAILVDLRLKMIKRKNKKSPSTIVKLKEKMFDLNVKKDQSIDSII